MQAKRKKNLGNPLSSQILKNIREVSIICIATVSILLFIALSSFSPEDPGWSHSTPVDIIQNNAGIIGAWVADFLLFLFGYLAYTFPFILAYSGWRIFRSIQNEKHVNYGHYAVRVVGFILALIGTCGLAWLHFRVGDGLPLAIKGAGGGVLGYEFGNLLASNFGHTGSTLVLLTMSLVGVTLFTDFSWLWVMDITGHYTFKVLDFISGQRELRQDHELGKQAKRERDAVLEIEKERSEGRSPVKIEPIISEFEVSSREQTEKQVNLFELSDDTALPPLELLDIAPEPKGQYSRESLEAVSRQLELKLKDFGIEAQVVEVLPGPVITRFEIQPAPGIKGNQIINLAKDIARSLSVVSVRVVDVIPGKSVIGVEIPNEYRELVALSDIFRSKEYDAMKSSLTIGLGKNISGQPVVADMAKMPHLLVAGTTGSGKSVALNAMILSLLYKSTPKDIRLIMIDPKMLELSVYEGIPHLLAPVVTDMKEASNALRWCVAEMERRYKLMASLGVRNIAGYNRKIEEANKRKEPIPDTSYRPVNEDDPVHYLENLPLIVVIVDELADMLMTTGKKVEELIARLAQKARAAGIHLILATQRPSVDVITGLIKANIPSRIAFQVSSKVDSRTILDQMGAETLLGHGDMLYLPAGTSIPERIHGAFVDDHEVHAVVQNIKSRGEPSYNDDVLNPPEEGGVQPVAGIDAASGEIDPLYDEAVQIITESRKASISYVQRRLRVGYNRAARIIEAMERSGLVSHMNSNGSREVLASAPPSID